MKTKLLENQVALLEQGHIRSAAFIAWLKVRLGDIELSDTADCDLSASFPWFYVKNREDLQELMKIAPRWDKSPSGKRIQYSAMCDGFSVYIYAQDEALPPTCRVIKAVREIPAAPARIEEYETIQCDV